MVRAGRPDDPTEMEIIMLPEVFIGLAVTSHNTSATTAAVFSDVTTTGNVSGAWTAEAIGGEHPSNDAASMYVVVTDSGGREQMVTHPNSEVAVLTSWELAYFGRKLK